ncbi:MAG: histidine kinase dimerization/phosphoacceptor domain -containing protein [Bacteroidota bacterium]
MKIYSLQLVLFSCCFVGSSPNLLQAQELLPVQTVEQEYQYGLKLLDAFKNDSANIVFTSLIQHLEMLDALDDSFGLKVRMRQAEALEKDNQDQVAIEKLITIVKVSKKKKEWEVLANAQLSLARLHEKLGQQKACFRYLELARSTIKEQELENVYPRFAIRMASYHRIINEQLDSALHYAQEVIQTTTKLNQFDHLGTGHMLMGLILSKSNDEAAAVHYQKASRIFKRLGNSTGYGYMQNNLSRLYLRTGQAKRSLIHSDSFAIAIQQSILAGHDDLGLQYYYFKDRAKIYQALGQHDSAWQYLNKGYQTELQDLRQTNYEKIVEVEERYQDEQKVQKIEDQAQIIQLEQSRKKWLTGLSSVVILFAVMLTYFYVRLIKASKKTKQQALAITQVNQELSTSLRHQITLRGEVHHRVKNNLQVIISLLELQAEDIEDEKALQSLETMSNRVYSMAAIHEMLYQKQGTRLINLLEYTQNLCQHFSNITTRQNQPIFDINIDERFFNLETLMPLGMILNELLTNSIKYASSIEKRLKIGISLQPKADGYSIIYRDNGPGFSQGKLAEREGGLGTYLLKSMSRQLNGKLVSRNDNGAVYEIFFKEKNANKKITPSPFVSAMS